jgi:hypothetical protein
MRYSAMGLKERSIHRHSLFRRLIPTELLTPIEALTTDVAEIDCRNAERLPDRFVARTQSEQNGVGTTEHTGAGLVG